MRRTHKWFLVFASAIMVQCQDSAVLHRNYVSTASGWNMPIRFEIPATLLKNKKLNFFIHLRNNDDYPYSNIFLIASIKDSLQTIVTDTLEYGMATPQGKWLGSGFSGLKESKLWWKEGYEWGDFSGNTLFEIKQVVRNNGSEKGVESLPGIVDVGISIENYLE